MKTYSHVFCIAFGVPGSTTMDGSDITAERMQKALLDRVLTLLPGELLESVGLPDETDEEGVES